MNHLNIPYLAFILLTLSLGVFPGCAQTTLRQPASVSQSTPSYVRCEAKIGGALALTADDNASLLSSLSRDGYFAPVLTAGHLRLIDLRTMREAENYDISALTKHASDDSNGGQDFNYSDLSWSSSGNYILISSNRLDEDRQLIVDRPNKKTTLLATQGNSWLEQQDTLVQDVGSKSITLLDAASLSSTVYDTPGRPGGRLLNYPPSTLRNDLVIIQDTPKPRAVIYSLEKKAVSQRYQFPKLGSVVSLSPYGGYAIVAQNSSGKTSVNPDLTVVRLSDMKTIALVKGGSAIKASFLEVGTEVILYNHLVGTAKRSGLSFAALHIDLDSWRVTAEHPDRFEWSFNPISIPSSQGDYIATRTDVSGNAPPVYSLRGAGEQTLFTQNSSPGLSYPSLETIAQSSWLRINGSSADQIGLIDSQNPGQVYYYNVPGIEETAGGDSAWFTSAGFLVRSDQALKIYTFQTQGCAPDSFHF